MSLDPKVEERKLEAATAELRHIATKRERGVQPLYGQIFTDDAAVILAALARLKDAEEVIGFYADKDGYPKTLDAYAKRSEASEPTIALHDKGSRARAYREKHPREGEG